jgi:hypothetical protein
MGEPDGFLSDQACETRPGCKEWTGGWRPQAAGTPDTPVQNKANSPRVRLCETKPTRRPSRSSEGRRAAEKTKPTGGVVGRGPAIPRKTKPIRIRRKLAPSPLQERSYERHIRLDSLSKRSQFPWQGGKTKPSPMEGQRVGVWPEYGGGRCGFRSMGVSPMSRRAIPRRRGDRLWPCRRTPDSTGETPVILMAKMAMLRECRRSACEFVGIRHHIPTAPRCSTGAGKCLQGRADSPKKGRPCARSTRTVGEPFCGTL